MACTGDYDLVCCGHSHEASIARQIHIGGGEAWLVNAGTVAGVGGEPCWIFGDLEAMRFELRRG
jgi:predicted phosphodiesterase